jgi:hypothetical protein
MRRYDRLSVLVSLILLGLIVSQVIELPTRIISFIALGVPTTIYLSSRWFIGAILVILAATGTDSIVRSLPGAHHADLGYRFSFWGLPCVLTLLFLFLLSLCPNTLVWLVGLGLSGLTLSLTIVAQCHTVDQSDRYYKVARSGLNLAVYLTGLASFALIYGARARSLLSATAIALLAAALASELYRSDVSREDTKRTWLYTLIVGFVLGEVTWALNHCSLSDLAGGLFLLLAFYVTSGLAGQYLAGKLSRHVTIEFAIVTLLGLAMLCFI